MALKAQQLCGHGPDGTDAQHLGPEGLHLCPAQAQNLPLSRSYIGPVSSQQ